MDCCSPLPYIEESPFKDRLGIERYRGVAFEALRSVIRYEEVMMDGKVCEAPGSISKLRVELSLPWKEAKSPSKLEASIVIPEYFRSSPKKTGGNKKSAVTQAGLVQAEKLVSK